MKPLVPFMAGLLAPPVQVRWQDAPSAPTAGQVSVEDVAVYTWDALPDGVYRMDSPSGTNVWLEPGFPTGDAPHAVLGQLSARREGQPEEKIREKVAESAAEHGANALIELSAPDAGSLRMVALRLSDAPPPVEARPPAAELLATVDLAPYRATGLELERRLETWEPVTIDSARGRCYAMALALDEDARLSGDARRVLKVDTRPPGQSYETSQMFFRPDDPRSKRLHTQSIGCPQRSGPLVVDLLVAGPGKERPSIGEGGVTLRIYDKPISDAELAERARKVKEGFEAAEASSKARAAEACSECSPALLGCGAAEAKDCTAFRQCLERKYVRVEECF